VKHLTALVEEAARKNRSLIAIGSELPVIFSFSSFVHVELVVLQSGSFSSRGA
jgi:hypothetical protein